ncbi:MAG: DUF4870 domain-containing protein [Dehalococcoidia bacterium]|nr:DUF4870 domain-containing protein [Dehalococcoidia bacterium]
MGTQDERTMAMLAHGSAILNVITGIGGIAVALVIYLTQKEKSPWVAFQALQSLIFQTVVSVVLWIAVFISVLLMSILIGCITLPITLLLAVGAIAYSLYGAIQVYQGSEFRYVFVGDWLSQQMPPSPPDA